MSRPQALDSQAASRRLDTDIPQLILGAAFLVAFVAVPEWVGSIYWGGISKLFVLYLASAVFMSTLYVDAGQTSFGQGAIFGASAYMVAIAWQTLGLPFALSALCGLAAGLLVGVLFALPALRVQGFYLGFVTLSGAMVFPDLLLAFNAYTQGISGISVKFPSLTQSTALGLSPLALLIGTLGIAALSFQVVLKRSPLGRGMRMAAFSPEAALSLGMRPGRLRFAAFLISALGTGLAGTLYPPTIGYVSPNAFHVELSILFFFALIVGGKGQPLGPILGLALLYLVPNVFLAKFVEYRLLIYGCVALGVMLLMPHGIVGTFESLRRRFQSAVPGAPLRLDGLVDAGVDGASLKPVAVAGQLPTAIALTVSDACKSFGRVIALDHVTLAVRQGTIHGLVGANGSGKTSLLNVLSGFSRLDEGSVQVGSHAINTQSADQIARAGIGRTFQTPRIVPGLSVWENLQLGLDGLAARTALSVPSSVIENLRAAFHNRSIDTVPHGQRRLLEVIRVVLKGADILLLDEPAAGLSPDERVQFQTLLRNLRDRLGKTIIIVEHDLDLVWGVADEITVLETGRVVASGPPSQVAGNPAAAHLFIGGRHAAG